MTYSWPREFLSWLCKDHQPRPVSRPLSCARHPSPQFKACSLARCFVLQLGTLSLPIVITCACPAGTFSSHETAFYANLQLSFYSTDNDHWYVWLILWSVLPLIHFAISSFIHWSVHWSNNPFIHSFIHSLIHSFIYSFVHSFFIKW